MASNIHKTKTLMLPILLIALGVGLSFLASPPAHAQDVLPAKSEGDKGRIIESFFQRIESKLKSSVSEWETNAAPEPEENILEEGETLFLNVRLPKRVKLEGVIFGQARNKKVVVSLRDFSDVLNLPIAVDIDSQTASGWYLRENKTFDLDVSNQIAVTDNGTFTLSEDVYIEGEDLFVPIDELAQWLNFQIEPLISSQEILVTPSQPLPYQEQRERKAKNRIARKLPEPSLPEREFPRRLVDVPVIDVNTNVTYEKDGETKKGESRYTGNVTTKGDFAYGTLSTFSRYEKEEGLVSVQANYKQESAKPELLGKLKARKYEFGDITTVNMPLANSVKQDLGVRVTNRDPLNTLTSPSSVISGNTFPGWDVELYRDNQFLGFQTVDENGFFSFENVNLFSQNNDFKLIFYGPQGEIREQNISIPVDTQRLSDSAGIYDVSLTFEDEQTYLKNKADEDQDSGSPTLIALYEKPLSGGTAASAGFTTSTTEGERNYIAQAGLSSLLDRTLLNFNVAADDELDMDAELGLRHNIGKHQFSNIAKFTSSGFDSAAGEEDQDNSVFRENFSVVGPVPALENLNARYAANINFTETSDGDTSLTSNLGLNARWKDLTFNNNLNYLSSDSLEEDEVSLLSTVSGQYRKNRIRGIVNYDLKPKREIRSVIANVSRKISDDLDIRGEVERTFRPESLTSGSLNVDWKAGFARLSPRIEYNSDNDLFVGLNTRYSILREPHTKQFKTVDRNVSGNGGFSAFVYLDENGNLEFDEGEQPLEYVVVKATQNGGLETTDEDGIALFTNMTELKLTDVAIVEESLEDPLWIPGFEGVSVIPREGYYAQVSYPVHIGGEIDGTVYGRDGSGEEKGLKNVRLGLYDQNGDRVDKTVTDFSGFYFFSRVPPGTYYLMIEEKSAASHNFARPKPEKINIGYEGTLIFGKDIRVNLDQQDVPSDIVKDYNAFKERHPHIAFHPETHDVVLNLGEYSSRTLMGLIWHKLNKQYANLLNATELYVSPVESFADPKTGKHTLRAGVKKDRQHHAYDICAQLIQSGFACKVELLPEGLKTLHLSQAQTGNAIP